MAGSVIDFVDFSYTYPGRRDPSLSGVTFSVGEGELVLISGPTGCGKSTLLRSMNGIIPHDSGGTLEGSVHVLGRNTRDTDLAWLSSHAGLVFQSPDDQLFSSRPVDEVAFGLENLNTEPDVISERVKWALDEVGLTEVVGTPVSELSGGQKQRLAVAAVVAMHPKVLLLDEPLSQLDPAGAEQVLDVISRLRKDLGLAVVLVEHRMHGVVRFADRVVLMDEGKIVLDAPAARAFDDTEVYHRLGLRLPEPVELMERLGRPERPLCAADAIALLGNVSEIDGSLSLRERVGVRENESEHPQAHDTGDNKALAELSGVGVRYTRRGPTVLSDIDLAIRPGDVIALMGANGSGKSTLLYALLGGLRPFCGTGHVLAEDVTGRRRLGGEVGMLFQNPDLMLLADRVDEEVAAGAVNMGLDSDEVAGRCRDVMRALAIENLQSEAPLALSRGQRLRVSLASLLSMTPKLLLLDEPTTGQDRLQIESMMDHLVESLEGRAVVFCTHDVLTAAQYATRVVILAEGRVIADGPPGEVFADGKILGRASIHPPVSVEISRAIGLGSLTTMDELVDRLSRGGAG